MPPKKYASFPARSQTTPAPRFSQQPIAAAPEPASSDKLLKITGYPAVAALFRSEPERIVRFFYEERMIPKIGSFCAYMAGQHRPYRMLDAAELSKVAGTVRHGGIVAIAEPRPLQSLSVEEARLWARTSKHPLFVLDGIGNTHNVGAIARTLAFFGHDKLILSDHPAQAGLSDSAHRVAEGGLEYLQVYRANRLPTLLHALKPNYRIVGTALNQGIPLEKLPEDSRPTLILLGNEELGLTPATLKATEVIIKIQAKGAVQSLNVSATAAILAYALQTPPATPRSNRPTASPSGFKKNHRRPSSKSSQ